MTFQRDLKRFEGVWIKSTLDSANALGDARRLYWDFDRCPSKVKLIIADMMFNLGYSKLSKFKKKKAAVHR